MKHGCHLCLLLIFLASGSWAQYSNKVHFRNISVKDGLSFPVINCILQDSKGFVWIGTALGLNKYDSQKFKVYYADPADSTSLSDDHISSLYEDRQGRLWVGTLRGLNIYDRRTAVFTKFQDGRLKHERILAITGDETGNTWVLTRQFLFLINEELEIAEKHFVSDIAADAALTDFGTGKVDPQGNLWVITNGGLRMFDRSAGKLTNPLQDYTDYLSITLEFFSSLYFDKKGRTWVAGRGSGAKYHDPATGRWKQLEQLSSRFVNGLVEDVNGRIWICTGRNGLNFYDPETDEVEVIRYAEKPESNFVSNSLSCIYADDMGGIWIGTFNNGLQYYFQHQLKFDLYYSEGQISGINSNYITAFAPDQKNNIWIGAGEEGLLYFDRQHRKFSTIRPVDTDPQHLGELRENFYILALLLSEDRDHLFVGTLTGFYHYHLSENKWRYFHNQEGAGKSLSGAFVISLVQDGELVYLATSEGLSVYNYRDQSISNYRPQLPDFRIQAIVQDEASVFLATRYAGLYRFSKATAAIEKVVSTDPDLKLPERIQNLYLDKHKRLLICSTFDGLFRYHPAGGSVEHLDEQRQDNKLTFMTICEDPVSGYWMASNQGLVKVSESLEIERIFDQKEGFEPTYFLHNAILNHADEEILVGGNAGFYAFSPAGFYSPANLSTRIHLTDFLLLNKSVVSSEVGGFKVEGDLDAHRSIRLPRYQNLLTFEYTALDYHNPARIAYAYKLEPYESDWNLVANRRYATYRDLPAGAYTFMVKYEPDGEDIPEHIAQLKVTIPPRPWLSWWAVLLYGGIVFAVSRQFYLYRRNRRRLRQEIEMQRFQKEKMEELYNFKIDFFTQVTHELRTPLTLILSPLEEVIQRNRSTSDRNLLKMIHRNAQKLLRTVNQILDFRKIEHLEMKVFAKKGNIVAFAQEIFYSFLRLTEKKDIELRFETNMEQYPFVLFDKDIMEKILVNLISNAVKFTRSGVISLRVYEQEEGRPGTHYHIEITDTGQGIKPENLDRIFESFFQEKREAGVMGSGLGLKMVKELTQLHHGTVEVRSKVNAGTTFLLTFPRADLDLVNEEPLKPGITWQMEQAVEPLQGPPDGFTTAAKLLLVDDEADVLAFLEELFTGHYQVHAVDSARKAIDVAKAEMPDLIISDVMMPEMSGYELCAYTKSDFLLSHIPVILLTALNTTEHEIEGLKTGADAYISKPFPPNLLKATVQNLLISRQKLKQAFLNSAVNDAKVLTQNNADQEFMEKVITLIERNIDRTELETSDISDQLGMSSSTFYRKLKSLTDLSGNEFIRTVRLKRSLEYLKNSDLNISEIAYQVGFSDPKYFSTCFKKFYNITPTDFLAQNRSEQRSA